MTQTLRGVCNQCGLCCKPHGLRCCNLIEIKTPGQPMATQCAIYNSRYDGMPILLFDKEGRVSGTGYCSKDSIHEVQGILQWGIGKGCSLEVVEE